MVSERLTDARNLSDGPHIPAIRGGANGMIEASRTSQPCDISDKSGGLLDGNRRSSSGYASMGRGRCRFGCPCIPHRLLLYSGAMREAFQG